MKERFHVDDYVNVWVEVYEKYFDQGEIAELIQVQKGINASQPYPLSDALRKKLSSKAVAMQSEILGKCTQLGAQAGGEIGQEIAQQHPDWIAKGQPNAKAKSNE